MIKGHRNRLSTNFSEIRSRESFDFISLQRSFIIIKSLSKARMLLSSNVVEIFELPITPRRKFGFSIGCYGT